MNWIKSAKYFQIDSERKLINITGKDGKTYSVPNGTQTENRHYKDLQEWVKIDGNTIADAD